MFIPIKTSYGKDVWVNPDHVAAVYDKANGCEITLSNSGVIMCDESADEMTDYIIEQCNESE